VTIIIAVIAYWPIPALHPIRKITPNVLRIVQQGSVARKVLSAPVLTVPELAAIVGIRIPPVPHIRAVQRMVAVRRQRRLVLAPLVAIVANRSLAALHPIRRVAPNVNRIVQHVVFAGEVLADAVRAVPVLPAVELVRVPAGGHIRAV